MFTHFLAFPLASGQALSDPNTMYIEGRLAGRRVWWCPSGYGTIYTYILFGKRICWGINLLGIRHFAWNLVGWWSDDWWILLGNEFCCGLVILKLCWLINSLGKLILLGIVL
jgi:hypothetical protein